MIKVMLPRDTQKIWPTFEAYHQLLTHIINTAFLSSTRDITNIYDHKQNVFYYSSRDTVLGEKGSDVVRGVFGVEIVRQSDCCELELMLERFRFLFIWLIWTSTDTILRCIQAFRHGYIQKCNDHKNVLEECCSAVCSIQCSMLHTVYNHRILIETVPERRLVVRALAVLESLNSVDFLWALRILGSPNLNFVNWV